MRAEDARLRPLFDFVMEYWAPHLPKKRSKKPLPEPEEPEERKQAEEGGGDAEGEEEEAFEDDEEVEVGGASGQETRDEQMEVGTPQLSQALLSTLGLRVDYPDPPSAYVRRKSQQETKETQEERSCPENVDEQLALIERSDCTSAV